MTHEPMDIGISKNLGASTDFGGLRIERRWFTPKFLLLTLFIIVWDAFLVNWYSLQFRSPGGPLGIDLLFLLFPLGHVAVGIGLTYYVLAGYLNRTRIEVDYESLRVTHGPVPFWGNKQVPSRELAQLYSKLDEFPLARRGYNTFAVNAITRDRRNINLLTGLDTREQALFIEQEIEKYLRIEDRPVKGSIR